MSHTKKILAVVLVVVSVLSIGIPAMAEWGRTSKSSPLYTDITMKYNHGTLASGTLVSLGRFNGSLQYIVVGAADRNKGTNANLKMYEGWIPHSIINPE